MQTYRVVRLSAQGQSTDAGERHGELHCTSDARAIAEAQLIENEYGLELWDGARLVRVFPPMSFAAVETLPDDSPLRSAMRSRLARSVAKPVTRSRSAA
jgi:hypothetical protein